MKKSIISLLDQPDVILFIKETINRWKAKNPRYFKVWSVINYGLFIAGAILTTLLETGVIKTPLWVQIATWSLAACGLWGKANSGAVVKPSDLDKVDLPLTDKKNIEKAIKEGEPRKD